MVWCFFSIFSADVSEFFFVAIISVKYSWVGLGQSDIWVRFSVFLSSGHPPAQAAFLLRLYFQTFRCISHLPVKMTTMMLDSWTSSCLWMWKCDVCMKEVSEFHVNAGCTTPGKTIVNGYFIENRLPHHSQWSFCMACRVITDQYLIALLIMVCNGLLAVTVTGLFRCWIFVLHCRPIIVCKCYKELVTELNFSLRMIPYFHIVYLNKWSDSSWNSNGLHNWHFWPVTLKL